MTTTVTAPLSTNFRLLLGLPGQFIRHFNWNVNKTRLNVCVNLLSEIFKKKLTHLKFQVFDFVPLSLYVLPAKLRNTRLYRNKFMTSRLAGSPLVEKLEGRRDDRKRKSSGSENRRLQNKP